MLSNNNKMNRFSLLFITLLGTMSTTTFVSSQIFVKCLGPGGKNTGPFCNSPKGTCTQLEGDDFETCVCGFGKTDPPNCDNDLDECSATDGSPCNGPEGSSFCVNEFLPTRYKCGCMPGWNATLSKNSTEFAPVLVENRPLDCVDVNECEEDPDICGSEASCENIPGAYNCICTDNTLIYDGTTSTCVEQPSMSPSAAPSLQPSAAPSLKPTTQAAPTPDTVAKKGVSSSSTVPQQNAVPFFLTITTLVLSMMMIFH